MWRLSTVVPSNFGQNCPKLGHYCSPLAQPIAVHFTSSNREPASNPLRFFHHWRRFSGFLETASLYLPPAALRLFPAGALVREEDSEDQQISLL